MAAANFTVAGASDSGKTTWIKHEPLPNLPRHGRKVPIVDVENEYGDVADAKIQRPEQFVPAFKDGHDIVRWVPGNLKNPELGKEALEHNAEQLDRAIMCWTAYPGATTGLIEEAHNFQTNQKIYSAALAKLMKQGDKYQHNVIQASQEPQDFHRSCWYNGGDVVVFGLRNTPKKLKELLDGQDPTELQRYHYIHIPSDPYAAAKIYPPISI